MTAASADSPALIDQQVSWVLQGLNSYSGSGEIARHLEDFPIMDRESLTSHLVHSIRSGKCPAKTKLQFVRWALRQIDRQADALLPFAIAKRIREQGRNLTVRDVLDIAAVHGTHNGGSFPRTIQNGNIALVDTGKGVLKIPACPDSDDPAQNFLPILQLLWPWHERGGKLYKHSTRQSYASGRWLAYRLPLHRVYAAFASGADSDEPIKARDGDFLNWCGGNLYRAGNESQAQSRFERGLLQIATGADGEELWPRGLFDLPALPNKPNGNGPDEDADPFSTTFQAGIEKSLQNHG